MTCYSKDSPQLVEASKKLRARLRQPKAESSLRIWPCYKPPSTTIKKPPNIATLHNHTLRIWLHNRIAPPNPPKKRLAKCLFHDDSTASATTTTSHLRPPLAPIDTNVTPLPTPHDAPSDTSLHKSRKQIKRERTKLMKAKRFR